MSSGAKGPGLFFVLPCIDEIHQVDLRTVVVDVSFFYRMEIKFLLSLNFY
jgi:hypothetical protein